MRRHDTPYLSQWKKCGINWRKINFGVGLSMPNFFSFRTQVIVYENKKPSIEIEEAHAQTFLDFETFETFLHNFIITKTINVENWYKCKTHSCNKSRTRLTCMQNLVWPLPPRPNVSGEVPHSYSLHLTRSDAGDKCIYQVQFKSVEN